MSIDRFHSCLLTSTTKVAAVPTVPINDPGHDIFDVDAVTDATVKQTVGDQIRNEIVIKVVGSVAHSPAVDTVTVGQCVADVDPLATGRRRAFWKACRGQTRPGKETQSLTTLQSAD
jgi:hypothetical protein